MPLAKAPALQTTIANGQSLSDAVDVGSGRVLGFNLPTLTAAVLTFQGSDDGVTFANLKDAAGVEVQVSSSTGGIFVTAPAALQAVVFLKIRTGTAGAPVNQGAQRVIGVVVK